MNKHKAIYGSDNRRSEHPVNRNGIVARAYFPPLLLAVMILLSIIPLPAFAATPRAGTVIENKAFASYYNPVLDRSETMESNPVQVIVQPVEALSMVADQQLFRSPGAPVSFSHILTNTGNTPLSAFLTTTTATGSTFTLSGLTLTRDLNQNGIADYGEPQIPQNGMIGLAAGQSVSLIISGTVPSNAMQTQSSSIAISAVSSIQGVKAAVTDQVLVNSAALLQAGKQSSDYNPTPGQQVTFTLSVVNNGNGTAQGGQTIQVDGAPEQLVLLRDVLPFGCSYVNGSFKLQTNGTPLFHRTGDPPFTYTTLEPADASEIDEVAYGANALAVGKLAAFSFKVLIASTASGSIDNIGQAFYNNGVNPQQIEAASNTVTLTVQTPPPVITFFNSGTFVVPAQAARLGSPLYVQADAAACNTNPLLAEVRTIVITSAHSGDQESYSAQESGPDTGLFRIIGVETRDAATNPVVHGDAIIEAMKHDLLTASISGCGSSTVTARLLIDPGGIVFDSRTNQTVPGALVTLVDAATGGSCTLNGEANGPLANVLELDGVTAALNPVMTAANGSFDFPLVAPGRYTLCVKAPNGWKFPSQFIQTQLPGDRTIDVDGSYGRPFAVNANTGPVHIDLPVDPGPAGGLFVQKSTSRTTVEIGDVVDYTIKVKNSSGKLLKDVSLADRLPFGFSYQKSTARRDGSVTADPAGGSGPGLAFTLGDMNDGVTIRITYRLKVGPGAIKSDGINRAQATAAYGTVSNVASATVKVEQGVFTDKGIIIGKLFVDCDRDRLQGDKEPGIPGVRIYLEDGTYAISDSEGKYSFYGISPRSHVLKLDESTLPAGSELITLSNRHAGDAASRFVDLKAGELHRADFAEGSCTVGIIEQLKERRLKGEVFVPETKRGVDAKLVIDQQPLQPSDVKSRPASGLLGAETKLPYFSPVMTREQQQTRDVPRQEATVPAQLQDYADSMAGMDSKPGFIDLKDGDILPIAQSTVRVKGASGAPLKLLVNGETVDEGRIGKKMIVEDQKLEAREYVGVAFKPGENRLELIQSDPFGNPRGRVAVTVIAPDTLAKIELQTPVGDLAADGQTPLTVRIRLTDEKGVAITSRTPVTVESSLGRWDAKDLSDQEPGLQLFIEGGQADLKLFAPAEPGIATIRVNSGSIKVQQTVSFIPDLRPLIAVGVIEGTLNFRRMDPGAITPARSQDGFEQELQAISTSSDDKRISAAGRAAFFLKGKIKGDYLLTVSYDSDKDTREKLFRDINPDEFYPVYGDSSIRGFDAQSTGKFYVRIDKNRSYLLYGDFTTQSQAEARVLGAYNRSLTGVRGHYENSLMSANVFASQDRSRQIVDEIPALGVSGPYYLRTADIVANSEKIEIITRDRNQPSLIIRSVPMSRFSDYEIEALTGRIIFKEPLASRDSSLNPVYIRATYEAFQGGSEFWVAGGDAQLKLHQRLEIGGSYLRDENPLDRQEMGSVNATIKLAEKTFLLAEWARITRQTSGQGDGRRIELRHDGENLNLRIYGNQTENGFDNPSSAIAKGRTEVGAKARYTLNKKTALTTEAIFSEDAATLGNRKGIIVNIEHAVARYLKGELGVRYAKESATPSQTVGDATLTPTENTSIRAKLGLQLPFFTKLGLFAEYEQSIQASDRRTVAFGGDYQLAPQTRLYARHELISSLSGQFALNGSQQRNTTLLGIESEYMKDGHLFSEYRMRDALSGRDSESAVGLRNGWQLTSGIRLNTNVERITTIGGATANDSTALGAGVEYTGSERWKGSTRLEYRNGTGSDSYLGSIGLAHKYNRSITLLGRQIISYTQNKGSVSGVRVQQRSQAGLAYRPVDSNRWNLLSKYEFRYEGDDSDPSLPSTHIVHILSASLNFQPARSLVISGRYAAKLALDESGDISTRSAVQMLTGRMTYDLSKRWDVGLNAMALFNEKLSSVLYGLGNEVGYLMTSNLWLSAGYNYFGFHDKDLSGEDYTNPGYFMRMRFKFDEHLLDGLRGKTLNDVPR